MSANFTDYCRNMNADSRQITDYRPQCSLDKDLMNKAGLKTQREYADWLNTGKNVGALIAQQDMQKTYQDAPIFEVTSNTNNKIQSNDNGMMSSFISWLGF